MSDNGGSMSAKTMIGRERAIDESESEKEAFKFIVSPNRGVRVMLPIEHPFIWKYFEVFL